MSKPMQYEYLTAGGIIECERTEEQIRKLPSFGSVLEPVDGRPRLVAALHFWLQGQIELHADKPWHSFIDRHGVMHSLRPSAVYGFRILERLESQEEPRIGFDPLELAKRFAPKADRSDGEPQSE